MNVMDGLGVDEKLNSNIDKIASWHLWCRLCAKQDVQNISVFFKDEHMVATAGNGEQNELGLNIAIAKYFCVQVSKPYTCLIIIFIFKLILLYRLLTDKNE